MWKLSSVRTKYACNKMKWLTLLMSLLGALSYVQADCYPGNTRFVRIVQEIYHGVTSDNILLTGHGTGTLNRRDLCRILTNRHNYGRNSQAGQRYTNRQYLRSYIPLYKCVVALRYTRGYYSLSGWRAWAGYHRGTWYKTTESSSDGAQWNSPIGSTSYTFQKVRFDSQYRIDHCVTPDRMTRATCRYGWNQAGRGIRYVWGWDPKDNNCTSGYTQGRSGGAHVGFTFRYYRASCIVWVTNLEAFLECVRYNRRTSTASGPGVWRGYGQWTIIR